MRPCRWLSSFPAGCIPPAGSACQRNDSPPADSNFLNGLGGNSSTVAGFEHALGLRACRLLPSLPAGWEPANGQLFLNGLGESSSTAPRFLGCPWGCEPAVAFQPCQRDASPPTGSNFLNGLRGTSSTAPWFLPCPWLANLPLAVEPVSGLLFSHWPTGGSEHGPWTRKILWAASLPLYREPASGRVPRQRAVIFSRAYGRV